MSSKDRGLGRLWMAAFLLIDVFVFGSRSGKPAYRLYLI